jgi:isochorismate synthase
VDELRFRFPGEEVQYLKGHFSEVVNFEGLEGFVITDHSGQKKFHFKEGLDPVGSIQKIRIPHTVSKDEYLLQGSGFLDELKQSGIEKAVFSRVLKVVTDAQRGQVFEQLERSYPNAFVYLFESEKLGSWMGASPEILASWEKRVFTTTALAGTLPSVSLMKWSEKEIREQQAVTDFIIGIAGAYTEEIELGERQNVVAGPVRHLRTEVKFRLSKDKLWELISNLHPTPAVSGFPRVEALELIRKYELHDRKLYTGYLGRIGDDRAQLYVNLRCGEWIGNDFFLYLGGGFNDRSNIEKEWEETENKSRTLLNILQKGSFDQ